MQFQPVTAKLPLALLTCFVVSQLMGAQNPRSVRFKTLYSFTDFGSPVAGLIQDAAGNLYGTTANGGAYNSGSVFKLDRTGTLKVLYSFAGGDDGGYPQSSLVLDSAGNLYGTTPYEGSGSCAGGIGCGVVFRVDVTGAETVLHTFTGTDGIYPFAGLIRDSEGNLYGTTQYGGASGGGTVYKLDKDGKETVLYNFLSGSDGGQPLAGLVRDNDGNLYGTTSTGGAPSCNCGTVFKLDAGGNETVLLGFTGAEGESPEANLILDNKGNLYGTAYGGGAYGFGTVFRLDKRGREIVYSFTGGAGGIGPHSALVRDQSGNVYGTTQLGGVYGHGIIFVVTPSGKEVVLHSFQDLPDGSMPEAGLIPCAASTLCGTTEFGGRYGTGTVFAVTINCVC